ncbi:hypothetical protein F5Y09DRAFT_334237 [Xylaria sp. FL1042]|nr:hypothetical protein F5Y09DRAFT_334237 [Xylaria sp. FL1042]
MRMVDPADNGGADAYDEIYLKSWREALRECERTLEQDDHQRALQTKSLQDFRAELEALMREYNDDNFVSMMAHPVDVSMMWGLLFLVFKLALASSTHSITNQLVRGAMEPTNPLIRITQWLERIRHRLRASNDCKLESTHFGKIKGDTVEVNREIVILWLNIIMTVRNKSQGLESWLDDNAWKALTVTYNEAYSRIEDVVKRIEKVAEIAERQARAMHDVTIYQRLLSLESSKQDGVILPCNNLPVAENRKFFGREDILQKLEDHLTPADIKSPLSSIALYGLGGIGKTQIALAYAYRVINNVDAILWISAQDQLSVLQVSLA